MRPSKIKFSLKLEMIFKILRNGGVGGNVVVDAMADDGYKFISVAIRLQ